MTSDHGLTCSGAREADIPHDDTDQTPGTLVLVTSWPIPWPLLQHGAGLLLPGLGLEMVMIIIKQVKLNTTCILYLNKASRVPSIFLQGIVDILLWCIILICTSCSSPITSCVSSCLPFPSELLNQIVLLRLYPYYHPRLKKYQWISSIFTIPQHSCNVVKWHFL